MACGLEQLVTKQFLKFKKTNVEKNQLLNDCFTCEKWTLPGIFRLLIMTS